jgi:branched-chain amino acid transport system substrate-binding protein
MVVEQVNKAGGINGRKIELFILDNGSDPAKLLANLKLFKEKHNCVAMMTGVTTGVNLAAKAWAEQNHIPIISPDSQGQQLWQREGKAWWFRAHSVDILFAEVTLLRAKELGHTKIGVEGTTLSWGRDSLKGLKEIAPKYGVSIVGDVLCEPKSKDLSIQVRKLKDTGATAVILADYEAELGVWARGYMNIGWKPYSISLSGSTFYGALKTYPVELFEGWETVQLMDINKPIVKKVWDEYEAYTGKRYEDEKVPRTWDAIGLLIEGIKLSGNPDDPEAIRDALYKIKDFPIAIGRMGSKGSFVIGRNHLLGVEDIPIYVVRSGRFIPVQRK